METPSAQIETLNLESDDLKFGILNWLNWRGISGLLKVVGVDES